MPKDFDDWILFIMGLGIVGVIILAICLLLKALMMLPP